MSLLQFISHAIAASFLVIGVWMWELPLLKLYGERIDKLLTHEQIRMLSVGTGLILLVGWLISRVLGQPTITLFGNVSEFIQKRLKRTAKSNEHEQPDVHEMKRSDTIRALIFLFLVFSLVYVVGASILTAPRSEGWTNHILMIGLAVLCLCSPIQMILATLVVYACTGFGHFTLAQGTFMVGLGAWMVAFLILVKVTWWVVEKIDAKKDEGLILYLSATVFIIGSLQKPPIQPPSASAPSTYQYLCAPLEGNKGYFEVSTPEECASYYRRALPKLLDERSDIRVRELENRIAAMEDYVVFQDSFECPIFGQPPQLVNSVDECLDILNRKLAAQQATLDQAARELDDCEYDLKIEKRGPSTPPVDPPLPPPSQTQPPEEPIYLEG